MPKPSEEDAVVELLTWDPSDGTEEDGDELDDELPADEAFEGDEAFDEDFGDELEGEPVEEEPVDLPEVAADGYTGQKKAALPIDARAKSHPDLPRVKSTAFKRIIR